jgi:hypothetical protein
LNGAVAPGIAAPSRIGMGSRRSTTMGRENTLPKGVNGNDCVHRMDHSCGLCGSVERTTPNTTQVCR